MKIDICNNIYVHNCGWNNIISVIVRKIHVDLGNNDSSSKSSLGMDCQLSLNTSIPKK